MKEKQIIRNQVYVVLLALLFIVTLGFAAVSAEASTSRDNRMEQVAAPVSVEAVFGSPFRIHKEFTLEFNANGGSGKQSAVFSSNGSIKLPECKYTKTGYHFTGWKIGSRVYSAGSDFPCDSYGSTTATAQWAANTYTVKYNANGGSGSMANTSATYGSSFNLRYNSFSRTGYSFAGWSCNGTNYSDHASVNNLTSTNGGSVTMYARWSPKSITIYFEDGGGYGTQSPIYTSYDSSVTLPVCSFARDGYHFTGWKINGTVYSAGSSISNPCTGGQVAATAQWAINTYTIAFSANGGSGSMASIPATYGTAITLPANGFSKTGSSFSGWTCNGTSYANKASVKNLTSTNGATVTMTAQWKANSYTIVFEANGGTGTQNVINTTYGATVTLPACSFARTGYRFAGWKINGKVYNAGDKVQNLCTGGQVAATAQWTPITYTIAFAANGGTGTMS
ncbi:MAG: InlB B-repeat-containing protein, partial [Lachnospiraceae bacterium]|nr:InlB B-repeat-containing protein [Lachnospiraceae bacterium]